MMGQKKKYCSRQNIPTGRLVTTYYRLHLQSCTIDKYFWCICRTTLAQSIFHHIRATPCCTRGHNIQSYLPIAQQFVISAIVMTEIIADCTSSPQGGIYTGTYYVVWACLLALASGTSGKYLTYICIRSRNMQLGTFVRLLARGYSHKQYLMVTWSWNVVVVVVVVVFTLNRSFYQATSAVPPVSFLILHPREKQILWSQTVRQKKQTLKE